MSMSVYRAALLFGMGFILPVQACEASFWESAMASTVLAIETEDTEAAQIHYAQESSPLVDIRFERWRQDLPPGVSLVLPGGGLVNNGFPALSADGSRIAVLYHEHHPMTTAYPVLDIYETTELSLLEQIRFLPEQGDLAEDRLSEPEILLRVERRVRDISEFLNKGRFSSIPTLFNSGDIRNTPFVELGKLVLFEFDPASELWVLKIASDVAEQTDLEMKMPVIPVIEGSKDPYTDCSIGGVPDQGWYAPDIRVLVLKIRFRSARNDCDLPDQWLVKRV